MFPKIFRQQTCFLTSCLHLSPFLPLQKNRCNGGLHRIWGWHEPPEILGHLGRGLWTKPWSLCRCNRCHAATNAKVEQSLISRHRLIMTNLLDSINTDTSKKSTWEYIGAETVQVRTSYGTLCKIIRRSARVGSELRPTWIFSLALDRLTLSGQHSQMRWWRW